MALISIKLFPSCQAYNHMSHSYFGHHITLYVRVYIDDILLTGSSFKLIHDLITKLHDKFTLMVNTCKLSKHGTNVLIGPLLYRLIVEALQYLTLTQPNIAFFVNKACQFMANPL